MGCDRSVMVERQVETARNEPKSRRAYPGRAWWQRLTLTVEASQLAEATKGQAWLVVVMPHGLFTTWRLVFDGQVAKKSF